MNQLELIEVSSSTDPKTITTWITNSNWSIIILNCGLHHMLAFIFILRHHNRHIWHMSKKCNIKDTLMCFTISSDKSCTINPEDNI